MLDLVRHFPVLYFPPPSLPLPTGERPTCKHAKRVYMRKLEWPIYGDANEEAVTSVHSITNNASVLSS